MFSRASQARVEAAMRRVNRELFVPPEQRGNATKDAPLPIGWNQTISQPSLVARMTEELDVMSQSRVLEIGTGSGYQTAILAELVAEVFTIERLPELALAAEARLKELGYRNINFRVGDGAAGWPEEAPFSHIIVTAAAERMPPAWVEQLEPGGRIVAPVGSAATDTQVLILVEKDRDGVVLKRELCPVRFVPLVSGTQRP